MRLNVLLFAAAKDAAGSSPVQVDLPVGATVEDLRKTLVDLFPALAPMASQLLVAVNNTYSDSSDTLTESDEVACFPPVSGG